MSSAAVAVTQRQSLYDGLMAHRAGLADDHALASIYASWATGEGALPEWLGLEPRQWPRLMARHFPTALLEAPIASQERLLTRDRTAESEDLEELLLEHRAGRSETEEWVAKIIVAGCLGYNHLWQDLGLWSRQDLSALLAGNFPTLAAQNVHNMKWKKFLYKQLCAQAGAYVCRAPTCGECVDYQSCFGAED